MFDFREHSKFLGAHIVVTCQIQSFIVVRYREQGASEFRHSVIRMQGLRDQIIYHHFAMHIQQNVEQHSTVIGDLVHISFTPLNI